MRVTQCRTKNGLKQYVNPVPGKVTNSKRVEILLKNNRILDALYVHGKLTPEQGEAWKQCRQELPELAKTLPERTAGEVALKLTAIKAGFANPRGNNAETMRLEKLIWKLLKRLPKK